MRRRCDDGMDQTEGEKTMIGRLGSCVPDGALRRAKGFFPLIGDELFAMFMSGSMYNSAPVLS